ncbi:MAG TPA: hypothetical protein VG055_06075 [Planctomycetaceae bacterium]|nr:hypothetical protein [Planctomycetaceae bacterium]
MTRRLTVSLFCVAMTWSASVKGQVIQPGAQPQPLPHLSPPGFNLPQQYPRMRSQTPRPVRRPGVPAEMTPGPVPPGPSVAAPPGQAPVAAGPRQPMLSAFVVPSGLSEPIENLLSDLGFEDGKTFPLTPRTTFDLAYLCYADGRYADATVFASHGLRMCNDARLHLIKGVCELHRGFGTAAELTATEFRNAIAGQQVFGLDVARERINDARAVRFADIVEYQATGR